MQPPQPPGPGPDLPPAAGPAPGPGPGSAPGLFQTGQAQPGGFAPAFAPAAGALQPVPAHPGAPHYHSQLTRTILNVGAPTGGLIAAGVATALALGFNFFQNPALAILGGILAGAVSLLVVLAYLWLDRWEPEPPRLLLFAWLWGGVAVVFSLLTSLFDTDPFVSAVIRAPIVEELAKGAFLVLMITGLRRREVNTLTDCIVYAGLVGGAFGFLENILYLARGETVADSLAIAVIRLSTPFLHPFFTTLTAIGLYVGLSKSTRGAQWGFLGLGYSGAVVLHMIWNATGLAAHILLFLPLFGGAVALAIITRNREQRALLGQLPGLVQSGLIRPEEAAWLATLQGRKVWRTHAAQFSGPEARKQVVHLGGEITELAFARARAERGGVSQHLALRMEELTATVLGQPRPPVPPGPAPQPPSLTPAQPPRAEASWSPVPAGGPPAGWGAPGPGPQLPPGGPSAWGQPGGVEPHAPHGRPTGPHGRPAADGAYGPPPAPGGPYGPAGAAGGPYGPQGMQPGRQYQPPGAAGGYGGIAPAGAPGPDRVGGGLGPYAGPGAAGGPAPGQLGGQPPPDSDQTTRLDLDPGEPPR